MEKHNLSVHGGSGESDFEPDGGDVQEAEDE